MWKLYSGDFKIMGSIKVALITEGEKIKAKVEVKIESMDLQQSVENNLYDDTLRVP